MYTSRPDLDEAGARQRQAEVYQQIFGWFEKYGATFVDSGAELQGAHTATTVKALPMAAAQSSSTARSPRPKEMIGGFSIVDARPRRRARDGPGVACPGLPGRRRRDPSHRGPRRDVSHSRDDADALLADTVRREASSVVAFLYRLTGDFDVAEEAVQEALVSALHSWRRDGLPTSRARLAHDGGEAPGRRPAPPSRPATPSRGGLDAPLDSAVDSPPDGPSWSDGLPGPADADDRVPMLFGCCHPRWPSRLGSRSRCARRRRSDDGAHRCGLPGAGANGRPADRPPKRKIGSAGIPLAIPGPEEPPPDSTMSSRSSASRTPRPSSTPRQRGRVGWPRTRCGSPSWSARPRLASPRPGACSACSPCNRPRARISLRADGSLVLLPDQDRSRWDHRAIASAERYLERAAVWRRPGRFQLHAAIAACHASAPTWSRDDWLQILTLYDVLVRYDGSPVIRLNRAVALAEYAGPERALHEVDALADRLSGYHLLHATRAELLRRLGHTDEATAADREALRLATEPVDRDILSARLAAAQERSAADAWGWSTDRPPAASAGQLSPDPCDIAIAAGDGRAAKCSGGRVGGPPVASLERDDEQGEGCEEKMMTMSLILR